MGRRTYSLWRLLIGHISRSYLIPQLLLPTLLDTEETSGSHGSSLMIPSAVEDYLAIRALPYMTSGQFVLGKTNDQY
jgi:hypothetical protein